MMDMAMTDTELRIKGIEALNRDRGPVNVWSLRLHAQTF